MKHMYNQLLKELGISPDMNSYEISRQLKEKGNEKKSLMSSRLSLEENKRLEEEIHRINAAEVYYEKLAQDEKKGDKLDGFDYSSLQNKGRKNRRIRHVMRVAMDDTLQDDEKLSDEERYDNIIGLMGTPDGFNDGLKQLEQLAEDGYMIAQRRLGVMYFNGEKNIDVNWKKAGYWYEKAANQNDAYSQNMMGCIYSIKNNDLSIDMQRAKEWFKLSAEQDYPNACWNLAVCYDSLSEPRDVQAAFYWYKKAAEAGYTDAYNKMGIWYFCGIGGSTDIEEGIKWFVKGAEAGSADAYDNLGLCYLYGDGVSKDVNVAISWFKKAADQGNIKAYYHLGQAYDCYEDDINKKQLSTGIKKQQKQETKKHTINWEIIIVMGR